MSDLIADAAANLGDTAPSSAEPVQAPVPGNVLVNEASVVEAPNVVASGAQEQGASDAEQSKQLADGSATSVSGAESASSSTGNVLLNATPTVDGPNVAPAADAGAPAAGVVPVDGGEPLPRESHLMLLEAKLARFRAKLVNAERVALDEFEAIVGHIRAIL